MNALMLACLLAFFSVALLVAALLGRGIAPAAGAVAEPMRGPLVDSPMLARVVGLFARITDRAAFDPTRDRMRQRLVLAGSPYGGITAGQYLALMAAIACALFLLGSLMLLLSGSFSGLALLILLLVSALVFWLGGEWLGNLVTERQHQLGLAFPYFLDLAVMTMEAGTSFQESIDIYVNETRRNPLTEELNSVSSSMRMGKTLQEALDDFQSHTTVEDIQSTLRAIRQGIRMGTPLSIVLSEQADTLRFRRSQSAERVAEEIKVRMQGPAMLMMISVLLLILGPAFIEMFGSGVF
jgi:tight adherence protein C